MDILFLTVECIPFAWFLDLRLLPIPFLRFFPTRTILLGSLSLGIFIKYCTVFPPFWYFCSQRTASLCIVPSYTLRWRFMFIFTEENDVPPVRLEDCWYQYLSTRSICSIFACVGDAYSPTSLYRQFVSWSAMLTDVPWQSTVIGTVVEAVF